MDLANISIVTEVCEKYFPFTRVSISSFLKCNPWFTGKIYLVYDSRNPLPNRKITDITQLYSNVELVPVDILNIFPNFNLPKKNQANVIRQYLKFSAFSKIPGNVLYFSSFSLFFKGISQICQPNFITSSDQNLDLIYIPDHLKLANLDEFEYTSSNINASFQNHLKNYSSYLEITTNSYRSSLFSDSKYISLTQKLIRADYLVYDTFLGTQNSKHNKINAVWLNANQKFLSKLKSTPTATQYILSKSRESLSKSRESLSMRERCLKIIRDAQRIEKSPTYSLKESELLRSISEFKKIEKYSDSPAIQGYSTACVIAFKDRQPIVELNVKLLNEQTLPPAIVLVSSNLQDADFVERLRTKYKNVFAVHHPNYPIGGKWSAGVKFCKKLGVHGVMILGSDDLLSLDYFKACYESIDEGFGSSRNGVDLIGNRQWFIHTTSRKTYFLEYLPGVSIFLGGGKMFSKNFLDAVDWNIFKEFRPFHLDEYGYELVKKFSNSFAIIDPGHFIFSVKGKWEVINSADAILNTPSKISVNDVTLTTEKILTKLKLQNNATFESILS